MLLVAISFARRNYLCGIYIVKMSPPVVNLHHCNLFYRPLYFICPAYWVFDCGKWCLPYPSWHCKLHYACGDLRDEYILNQVLCILCCRNCRWKPEDDTGYDLDHHLKVCHPGHLCWGNDCKGRTVALVPTQDSTVQECQCAELPSQVCLIMIITILWL
jgi:hypothetical protein